MCGQQSVVVQLVCVFVKRLRVCARRFQLLAALAGLDLHVGQLLDFGRLADVVEDGERLQVLGDAAGRC